MKKLTAGIFTALLGLVTVNAANAAIPSTKYVDKRIDDIYNAYSAVDTVIRNEFAAADTALGNRITTNANAIGTLSQLTTTAQGNTVAAINEVNAAYKTADSNLLNQTIGTDAMGEIKIGENASVNPTTLTQAVNALNAKIDYKTSGIATDAALGELQDTVDDHGADITDLKTRMGTAEGEIDALQAKDTELSGSISANAAAIEVNTQAIAGKAAQSDLTALTTRVTTAEGDIGNLKAKDTELSGSISTNTAAIEANTNAIAGLGDVYDAKGAAATAQTNAVEYTDGKIADLALTYETKEKVAQSFQEAKAYAESEADAAETSANSYADEKLALKVDKAQGAEKANHVLITDGTGTVTTSATIEQTQVNGLSDALAAKLPVTAANNADGKYVLTATALNGTITYAWEDISREVPSDE